MGKKPIQKQLAVVILAAGKATRMESLTNKVLHPVAGKPMLEYVLSASKKLSPLKLVVVIGHQGDQVKERFRNESKIQWVRQKEMRGTGDAVNSAASALQLFQGSVLILYGDIPGIRVETLRRLGMVHGASAHAITLLTSELEHPTGYGRIVLDAEGSVGRIVEETDATDSEKEINEVNTGIGMYDAAFLFSSLKKLRPENEQGEYYLTDLVELARKSGRTVGRLCNKDPLETLGINDREALAEVSRIMCEEKMIALLKSGVSIDNPGTNSIEPMVEIGRDSHVEGQVAVKGNSRIGREVHLGSGVLVDSSDVGDKVQLGENVSVVQARIGRETMIGVNSTVGRKRKG